MKKKAIDLICSVAELTSLFERKRSIEGFLGKTVRLIAQHMETDLCSIYLVDQESGNLVLRASTGLNPEAIGNLTLASGEGITGTALKELRPILVPRGRDYPNFKPIPDIYEEEYEAFLAVPIIHGLRRIGVIVCQDKRVNYLTTRDARALTAIAAQMAAMIENALLLMELHKERPSAVGGHGNLPSILNGIKATPGIALGKSYSLGRSGAGLMLALESNRNYHTGLEEFSAALEATKGQIKSLQGELKKNFADIGSLIFHAHLLMLTDEAFSGEMEQLIRSGRSAPEAIVEVVNRYIRLFGEAETAAVREKTQDLKDLGHRLLYNLLIEDSSLQDYKDTIILTEELFPSELIKFAAQGAAGIIVHKTSITSHLQILGQSVKIPMLAVEDKRLFALDDGVPLILDGFQGNVFIEPDAETLDNFIRLAQEHSKLESSQEIDPVVKLHDNSSAVILANISLLGDLHLAKGHGARGVGLYRSEFPFLIRNDFPSEEEQYRIYRRIFEEFTAGPVNMRILDVGGDKQLEFISNLHEPNPFLGLRAIRFTLQNREILLSQLRAMLRAGHGGDLKIMIPFVSSIEEVRSIKSIVGQAMEELKVQEIDYNPAPDLGIMIELPSTGYILEELAAEVDFMSIGTNDLIQYLLGVDRTNPSVADLYNPFHPAVLRFLDSVARVCQRHSLPLSICGDSIVNRSMVRFALGIGIRVFSVSSAAIGQMHTWITSESNIEEAEKFSSRLLGLCSAEEIKAQTDKVIAV